MIIKHTKETLIDALKVQLEKAKLADKVAEVDHKKDEARALALFKKKIKAASKWTYAELKDAKFKCGLTDGGRGYANGEWFDIAKEQPARCPETKAPRIEREIHAIELSSQKTYTIESSGKYRSIFELLMADAPKLKTVCD